MRDDYGNPDPDWLKIDWRPHVQRLELPGATVNYAEIGEGEPVVFVHGLTSSWQAWLENMPHFGRSHRAIALDLPGFGASPMPSWTIDMHAYGRLLRDFCEKLEIGRDATLVGNSMGGLVAAEAVLAEPGRFNRLVLVSAAGFINTWLPHERGVATSHAWNTFGRPFGAAARFFVTHRRARYLMFRFAIRYPDRLSRELLWEQLGLGSALSRFRRRPRRGDRIRRPRPPRRDRDPDDDRLGHRRLGDPLGSRSQLPPPHPQFQARDL